MARIRSIKPEFPQSESMGRVSRDARLLFVMLWPICDDHGRTRASSRMLASLLFPYDDDAKDLIEGWMDELEREECIQRYEVNGSTFLFIRNWLIHQKIDKPSKPQFPDPPVILARIREDSWLEGKGREGKGEEAREPSRPKKQEPEAKPKSQQPAKKQKTSIPENFAVSENVRLWAKAKGFANLEDHLDSFVRKVKANGYTYIDWDSAFMEAIRADWAKLRTGGLFQPPQQPVRARKELGS